MLQKLGKVSRSLQKLLQTFPSFCSNYIILLARDVTYTSRAYAMMPVYLSVCLSVTELHWRIIANLGFKFRSHFTAHCGGRYPPPHRLNVNVMLSNITFLEFLQF